MLWLQNHKECYHLISTSPTFILECLLGFMSCCRRKAQSVSHWYWACLPYRRPWAGCGKVTLQSKSLGTATVARRQGFTLPSDELGCSERSPKWCEDTENRSGVFPRTNTHSLFMRKYETNPCKRNSTTYVTNALQRQEKIKNLWQAGNLMALEN